jgi:cytochrome b
VIQKDQIMKKLIYDLPTRILHWLFAMCFIGAFVIANLVDDESTAFAIHMLFGLTMLLIVLLRTIIGVCGSQYTKFSDFKLNLNQLVQYMAGIFKGSDRKWDGHNPASSWAAVIMFMLAFGLAVTGIFMVFIQHSDVLEEVHEILANSFFVIVILHVSGVMIHNLKHRDDLSSSMISGYKSGVSNEAKSVKSNNGLAILILTTIVIFNVLLWSNFSFEQGTLNIGGNSYQLTEPNEHGIRESKEEDDHENDRAQYRR